MCFNQHKQFNMSESQMFESLRVVVTLSEFHKEKKLAMRVKIYLCHGQISMT